MVGTLFNATLLHRPQAISGTMGLGTTGGVTMERVTIGGVTMGRVTSGGVGMLPSNPLASAVVKGRSTNTRSSSGRGGTV